jgi:hypothetical protein
MYSLCSINVSCREISFDGNDQNVTSGPKLVRSCVFSAMCRHFVIVREKWKSRREEAEEAEEKGERRRDIAIFIDFINSQRKEGFRRVGRIRQRSWPLPI